MLHALEIFSEIEQTRPNKQDTTGFIINNFKAQLVQIQVALLLQTQNDFTKPSVITSILSSCNVRKIIFFVSYLLLIFIIFSIEIEKLLVRTIKFRFYSRGLKIYA